MLKWAVCSQMLLSHWVKICFNHCVYSFRYLWNFKHYMTGHHLNLITFTAVTQRPIKNAMLSPISFRSGGKRREKNWQEMSLNKLKWVNVGRNIFLFDVVIIKSFKLRETLQSHTSRSKTRINSEFKLHCSEFCPVRSQNPPQMKNLQMNWNWAF